MRALTTMLLVGCAAEQAPPSADADADSDSDADADTDGDTDTGTASDTDTAPDPGCNTPDVECPPEHPHPGGPCEGDLSCEYFEDPNTWQYTCGGGGWDVDVDCQTEGCTPPLVESCDDPFAAELAGARIRIGPGGYDTFRPFDDGDTLGLRWGSQGSPMISFRIDLEGVDSPPECVLARFVLLNEAEGSSEPTVDRVRLRCGQSLALYAVVPFGGDLACAEEAGEIPVRIEVVLEGIGEAYEDVVIGYDSYEACWG